MMERRILPLLIALGLLAGVQRPGHSIEVRPEVSILGQPFARSTDDPNSEPLAGSSQLSVFTATLRAIFGMGPHKIRPF
jgi:hypothetical protein